MSELESVSVSRITLYPVKSLPGVEVDQATVLPSGALAGDRRWAMIDRHGKVVNAKRTPRIHELVATFQLATDEIQMGERSQEARETFSWTNDLTSLSRWLSDFFRYDITLVEDRETGFPDDTQAPGPTVISAETFAELTNWFEGLSIDQVRRRFRANIELSSAIPFWEDRLIGAAEVITQFQIGGVAFEGTNPCARCVVPTRDPDNGVVWPRFATEFATRRQDTLPVWEVSSRFDHFYRLAINTRLASDCTGGVLHVGDQVALVERVSRPVRSANGGV